jgi:hypothetical protein
MAQKSPPAVRVWLLRQGLRSQHPSTARPHDSADHECVKCVLANLSAVGPSNHDVRRPSFEHMHSLQPDQQGIEFRFAYQCVAFPRVFPEL